VFLEKPNGLSQYNTQGDDHIGDKFNVIEKVCLNYWVIIVDQLKIPMPNY
jgi:hypothetical protein